MNKRTLVRTTNLFLSAVNLKKRTLVRTTNCLLSRSIIGHDPMPNSKNEKNFSENSAILDLPFAALPAESSDRS